MSAGNPIDLSWSRLTGGALEIPALGFWLDFSTFPADPARRAALRPALLGALESMRQLEAGAVANPDENRRVGHYWLRQPDLAPDPELRAAIEGTLARVLEFGLQVRRGEAGPAPGVRFEHLLVLGIGGSALGPQLAADALGSPDDPLGVDFLDNTDPAGFDRLFRRLGERLDRTLCLVISKSGGTPETRNALVETWSRLLARGREPARQMVAVTGENSALDRRAREEGWLAVFPMWDWVGGRTSQTSAVGLLPMSILGHDAASLLEGARLMDQATRHPHPDLNPAARMAEAWHLASEGRGARDLVVLPYKDQLALFSRYLQQLIMESLGKSHDLAGREVSQGLTVFGNKGSTDQHAFVQQLRDGLDNFFALLIAVLEDGVSRPALEVEPEVTSGDYLLGFLLGTRAALAEKGRRLLTLTIPRVDARSLGGLIALFERSVGLYAGMIGINAYHQPGVEAGKKAAGEALQLQRRLLEVLRASPRESLTAAAWAQRAGKGNQAAEALWLLLHLSANPARGVRREPGKSVVEDRFGLGS